MMQVRLPADQQHVPLTVDFPEGSLIGVARERLPIVLTFSSQKPCSFTANVEFVDEEGFSYSLPVSASADASLLMLTPFLQVGCLKSLPEMRSPVQISQTMFPDLPQHNSKIIFPALNLLALFPFTSVVTWEKTTGT
jgi:hypothetical protein